MLSNQEKIRFAFLLQEFIPSPAIVDIVGVDPLDSFIRPGLREVAARLRRPLYDTGGTSRYLVELWLQRHRLLPRRAAALQLGMTEDSFTQLLSGLVQRGSIPTLNDALPESLVPEDLLRGMHRHFTGLQGRIFSNQTEYCRRLHAAAKAELGIKVQPVLCSVSKVLGDAPTDYAHYICAISHQPVGIRYSEILNSGKPLRLSPDEVSWMTIAQDYALLQPKLMGSGPPLTVLSKLLKSSKK